MKNIDEKMMTILNFLSTIPYDERIPAHVRAEYMVKINNILKND